MSEIASSRPLPSGMRPDAAQRRIFAFTKRFGDAHLYLNHLDQARAQLARQPRPLPRLRLNPAIKSLFDFTYDDVVIEGYDPHPAIRAPVAV